MLVSVPQKQVQYKKEKGFSIESEIQCYRHLLSLYPFLAAGMPLLSVSPFSPNVPSAPTSRQETEFKSAVAIFIKGNRGGVAAADWATGIPSQGWRHLVLWELLQLQFIHRKSGPPGEEKPDWRVPFSDIRESRATRNSGGEQGAAVFSKVRFREHLWSRHWGKALQPTGCLPKRESLHSPHTLHSPRPLDNTNFAPGLA